jgi:hypothetical protein
MATNAEDMAEIEKTIIDSQTKLNQHLKSYERFISPIAEDRRLLDEETQGCSRGTEPAKLDGALAVSRTNRLDDVKGRARKGSPLTRKSSSTTLKHI